MRNAMLLLAALMTTSLRSMAEPTDAHNDLKRAAFFAVSTGNTELLSALLKAGLQIDEPIDSDEGDTAPCWTALHYSVIHEQGRVTRMLIENGACVDIRDGYQQRPIDMACEEEQDQICSILAKGSKKDRMLVGCPLGVWDEYFISFHDIRTTNLVFIAVNGKDPVLDYSDRLKEIWPNSRLASAAVVLSLEEYEAARPPSAVRDKNTGEYGDQIDIKLVKKSNDEYEWGYRRYRGPLDANFSWGVITKKFGYWIRKCTGGGES